MTVPPACKHETTALEDVAEEETHPVLLNAACLYRVFSFTSDEAELAKAACVCTLWRDVVRSEDIWEACYTRNHGEQEPHDALSSYRALAARWRGLQSLRPLKPALLKGTAICYHAPSGSLVSFSARQRLLSIQSNSGTVRSSIVDEQGAGTCDRPLLVATSTSYVVLAAFDGALQVWDVAANRQAHVLGSHHSFITSMAADGNLLATTCSCELRLWDLSRRQCVYASLLNTAVPVQVEPKVVLSAATGILALANHTFPSDSVRVLSASAASYGAQLQLLAVNAASDLALHGGQLLVASSFQGRGGGSASLLSVVERPFTVVVHVWDTATWECTRMVSPRLWAYGSSHMHCRPIIHATQDLLMCCVPHHTDGLAACMQGLPYCTVHAWRLRQHQQARSKGGVPPAATVCVTSRSRVQGQAAGDGTSDATPAGGAAPVQHTQHHQQQQQQQHQEDGAGPLRSVMLVVADDGRDDWLPIIENTRGIVTSLLSTPTAVVLALKDGSVFTAAIPHMAAMFGLNEHSNSSSRRGSGSCAGSTCSGSGSSRRSSASRSSVGGSAFAALTLQ